MVRKKGFITSLVVSGCLLTLVSGVALAQQGAGVLRGQAIDEATQAPLADVVVKVRSPALQGEEVVVTDESGRYRFPKLPPGVYSIRFEKTDYQLFRRGEIRVRGDTTLRFDAALRPEVGEDVEEIVVVGGVPTVDVGTTQTVTSIGSEFTSRIPVALPTGKGAANRSIESVAEIAPQARGDLYGTSLSGTTSPENSYLIDGLSIGDPAYGIIGTPLSIEFVGELNVITAGYMPEYGRATGGVISAVSKSGSNEFHGSVWAYFTPGGALEGDRKVVKRQASTIITEPELDFIVDVGADIGGPIIEDKLWFYFGVDYAFTGYTLKRSLHRTTYDNDFNPILDSDGFYVKELIPGTEEDFAVESNTVQALGKLTYTLDTNNRFSLSMVGSPTFSGGDGKYGIDPQSGTFITNLNGPYSARSAKYENNTFDVALRWIATSDDNDYTLDTSVGWHYQEGGLFPADGSAIGGSSGYAGTSRMRWRRTGPQHSITDFEDIPDPSFCDPPAGAPEDLNPCAVSLYYTGGSGYIDRFILNRFQLRSVGSMLVDLLGSHEIKAGVDFEVLEYGHVTAYGGTRYLSETSSGSSFYELRSRAYLEGPDDVTVLDTLKATTQTLSIGGFMQDSWQLLDLVTLNFGFRYDAQYIYGGNDQLYIALPNQWSPRVGVIYDPTQEGDSKLYANFAIFYEGVPLNIADRFGSGEPTSYAPYRLNAEDCDPSAKDPVKSGCFDLNEPRTGWENDSSPNRKWAHWNGLSPVDPDLAPQSSSELVIGGEYDLFDIARVGVAYTRRWMNNVIEDMSRDEAQTFFVGNPGKGIATDFPEAERNYNAVTFYMMKTLGENWLAQVSYTLSYLRGNFAGLFKPETGQLDPNMNADFDLRSMLVNRYGPLPGDRRHTIKVYGAYDVEIGDFQITPGLAFTARSGGPTNYLGGHRIYGSDEIFILPRGSGDRLPWFYRLDFHLGVRVLFTEHYTLSLTADVFNMFNYQETTLVDETYTYSDVQPIRGGKVSQLNELLTVENEPLPEDEINEDYGKPIQYQRPLTVRFGIRGTF